MDDYLIASESLCTPKLKDAFVCDYHSSLSIITFSPAILFSSFSSLLDVILEVCIHFLKPFSFVADIQYVVF